MGGGFPWMREMAQALADAIPDARMRTLEGQEHNANLAALAPVLKDFFAG